MADVVRDGPRVDYGAPISSVVAKRGALSPGEIGRQVMERLRYTNRREDHMRRRIWAKNILYNRGEQRIRWDAGIRGYTKRQRDKRLQRYEANLLGVRGDHWVADVTQAMPYFTGLPENTDLESRSIAKLGERLVGVDWRLLNLDMGRSLASRDIWTCGTGFIEAGWNPDGGAVRTIHAKELDAEGNPAINDLGVPQLKVRGGRAVVERLEREGAPFARAVSPLMVYVPPTTDRPEMEACTYVQRLEWATESRIRALADEELPDDFEFVDDREFAYVDSALSLSSDYRGRDQDEGSGLHLVVHHYELRDSIEGWEQGKHFIVTADREIATESLEGEGDIYPLFAFGGRPRERQFWCHPEIGDRIASQRRRNDVLTHLVTWLGKFALPTIVAAKNSDVPEMYGMTGETIFYNPAYQPPTAMLPPQPSPALFQMLESATQEIDETGGDYPASRGVAVSAPSGHYLNLLQDAAAKRYGPVVRQHAWSWARLGEYLLKIHAAHDTDEQIIATIGRGNRAELVRVRNVQRLGSVRFVVQEASLVSALPSARIEQLRGLMTDGVLLNLLGQPPWPAPIRRALLDFMQMPAMGELELGTGILDRWADGVLTSLIEEGQEPPQDPLLNPEQVQFLLDALDVRKLQDDRREWDEETVQRVLAFKQGLEGLLQQAQEQQTQAADAEVQKQVDAQLQVETGKSKARAAEKTQTAFAKAKAEVLKEMIVPTPPPAPPPGPQAFGGANA